MSIIMNGKEIALILREKNQKQADVLIGQGVQPKMALIRVGEDPGSVGYHNSAIKTAEKNHIKTASFVYPEDISEEEFLKSLTKISNYNDIHGILVLRPLPAHIDSNKVSAVINPEKDIDGMSPVNIGRTLSPGQHDFVPITPVSVMRMLEYYNIELKGKEVVVIGHSLVVGRPLALLLMDKMATVTVCHIDTKETKLHTQKADIVISATGKRGLVTADFVKEGAVIVDVGTTYVDNKVYGDVKFDEVEPKASYINPVPGGIGILTSEILCERVIYAAVKMIGRSIDQKV